MSTPQPRMRKRANQYHHGDLRVALIAATTRLVERDGLAGLTLSRVATRVGVSAPAVYHHFSNKSDLVAAATGAAFEALDAELATIDGGSPAELLEAVALAYVGFAVERPGEFRLIYGSHIADLGLSDYPEVSEPGRRVKQRMRTVVAAAFGDEARTRTSEQRVAILWGQLVGIASLVMERELGPGIGLADAAALTRMAVRSHLVGLGDAR